MNMVTACLTALTDPWAFPWAVRTHSSLPHAAASLQASLSQPNPSEETLDKRNSEQNPGVGKWQARGCVRSARSQEEITETRLRHVSGDGMCRGDCSLPALAGCCGQRPAACPPERMCLVLSNEMPRERRHQKLGFW